MCRSSVSASRRSSSSLQVFILISLWPERNRCAPAFSLAAYELEHLFGISRALRFETCERLLNLCEVILRELHRRSSVVFFESMHLGRSRDRHHPGLLRQHPCECKLCARDLLPVRKFAQHVHDLLVGLTSLLIETRNRVAEVVCRKRCALIDRAGQEALAKRAERDEADAEFF